MWLVAALAGPRDAHAASDPARTWHTLESDHFAVHYYVDGYGDGGAGARLFAEAVAAHAEDARATLGPVFGWWPREKVHVAVFDEYDGANGFAAALPEPRMTIYAWPPTGDGELGHYRDWVRLLVFHEYAHIVHIDESHGVPELVNAVFGRVWKPNQVLPRWIVEGIAVWAESRLTGGGRLESGLMDMWLRVLAYHDVWPELSELNGYPLAPPRGTLWYLLGGHIIDTMVAGAGRDALAAFGEGYGGRILPFGVQGLAREASGTTWDEWYDRFRADRTASVRASVDAITARMRVGAVVHENDDDIDHLRWSPDGRWLYWVENDGHSQARIMRATRAALEAAQAGKRLEAALVGRCYGGCSSIDISRDGGRIAWTSQRFRRVGNLYGGIVVAPVDDGPRGRREHIAIDGTWRAHDVAWAHDGDSWWCVRASWGRTWLERFDRDGVSLQRIDAPPELASGGGSWPRFERPTPAFDGRSLFVVIHAHGNRDLWRIDLASPTPRFERWTRGGADELDLQGFAGADTVPSGVIFSADRDGVFNVFLASANDGARVDQLTDEPMGALNPALSPDGAWLAYTRASPRGRQLVLQVNPLGTATAAAPERPLQAVTPPTSVPLVVRSYDPLPTLTPRRWLPSLTLGGGGGGRIGFAVDHTDASRRLAARLALDWDFGLDDWSGWAQLAWLGGFVDVTLDLGRYVIDRTSNVGDLVEPWRQSTVWGTLGLGLPVPDVFAGTYLGLGYTVELAHGARFGRLEQRPDQTTPQIPREGLSGFLNLSVSFSDVRGFLFSPGPADGFSAAFNLAFRHPSIGSWNEAWTATAVLRGFLQMPWHDDHVLALRFGAGATTGSGPGRAWFSLGGAPNRDLLNDLLNQTAAGSVWLRGFAPDAFQGDRFWLGTLEYRLPLWRVRDGLGTLPVFVEDLQLAVFADLGGATSEPLPVFPLNTGFGAELRFRLDLVWGLIHDFRLGYAHGLGPGGVDAFYFMMSGAP